MAYVGFKKLGKEGLSKPLRAWIGRRKYGKEKFQHAAAKGKTMRGMKAKKQAEALEKE